MWFSLEGHDLVRTVQSGGILEVDLVLALGHLVVGRLNDEAGYFDLGPLDHGEPTRRRICLALGRR